MEKVLKEELTGYFECLSEKEQKSVVNLLKTIVEGKKSEWSEQEIDLYNKELDEAMDEMDKGTSFTHEEALKILVDRNNAKKAALA